MITIHDRGPGGRSVGRREVKRLLDGVPKNVIATISAGTPIRVFV